MYMRACHAHHHLICPVSPNKNHKNPSENAREFPTRLGCLWPRPNRKFQIASRIKALVPPRYWGIPKPSSDRPCIQGFPRRGVTLASNTAVPRLVLPKGTFGIAQPAGKSARRTAIPHTNPHSSSVASHLRRFLGE